MAESNATNAGNSPFRNKRIKNAHLALMVSIIMALMFFLAERDKILGTKKTNPCTALKKRAQIQTAWKEELVEKRSKSTDKDSIEQYYDFEIDLAEGHLENISDSLKRLLCIE